MNQPLIRLTEIAAAYDQKKVLEHINLEIAEKDFLGVIGPNGGGKTTLKKIILGLLKPSAGKIQFFHQGKEVNEITMGYLPQYNTIDKKFPISVYEVVLSGLNKQKSLFRSFSKAQHDKVRETIARMGLEGLEQRAIGQLSGGQLQRALLGRALVSNPEVVILDEPASALDPIAEAQVYENFDRLVNGKTAIYISHRMSSCRFCDDIMVFDDGRIAERGSHESLLAAKGLYSQLWNAQAKYYA